MPQPSDSAGPEEIHMQWDVRIPLRDGVHLAATLYLPREQKNPAPTICLLTPYVRQVYHDRGAYFASHGYPFLTIDVRGRGNSEGVFKANGNEAKDGHDVVEWLARQPYCNGKVTMWGGSYSGYTQWAAAREQPPHLATICPVASPFRGVDTPMRNNIFTPYRIQWLTYLSGRTAQDKIFADQGFWNRQYKRWLKSGTPFRQIDTLLGNPSPIIQEWLRHPERDAYWDGYNPTAEQYAKISLPILTITGSYDTNQLGAMKHYREHMKHATAEARSRHYLIIGPWDHAGTRIPAVEFGGLKVGPASLVDLAQLHLQWYAWTMQGGPKPEFLRKNVAYYVMVAEKWRYADTLEAVTARTETLYLQSSGQSNGNPDSVFNSGSLTHKPSPKSAPDHYVYDPRDVSLAELESKTDPGNWVDQRMVHAAAGKHLVYHSPPFEADTEIGGYFKFSAWLAIDQPDTDFVVSVYDVGIDGSAVLLSNDMQRARYREGLREAKLIDTKEPLRYDFDHFLFVSRLIKKGNRLRLVIGPVNSIFHQKNYNSGGAVADESVQDARTVTVKLFHDEAHPSALYIPLGHPQT